MFSEFDFDVMCEQLAERTNFSFSRFGDGEWSAVLGKTGQNCDSHRYYPELSLALAFVLLQPQRYNIGMQPKAMRDMPDEITSWCKKHTCEIEWCDADIIHDASIEGRLDEMWKAMRGRKKILVGPNHLKPLANRMGAAYVFVPDRNCFKWQTTIYSDLLSELDKDCVVLYCASMLTELLIDKAHADYGDTITQIDIGSAFAPYCGVSQRRYHRDIIQRIQEEGR
jgi:hypothetical protein